MKKIINGLVCLSLMFLLAGCGSKTNTVNDEQPEVKQEETLTIQSFVDSMKESVENFSNDTLTATLEAREDSVVYVYKYKQTFDKSLLSTMKESLETAIKKQPEAFENLLKTLKTQIPTAKSVIVEYYNGDGTLIASITFE